MSKTQNFSIFYESKETEHNTIDAESLGQSLVSFSKAIKQADRMINGPESTIDIDVKAHKPGSFGVEFELTQILESARDVLQYLGIAATSGAIAGGGLMALLKKIGNRKVIGSVKNQDGKSIIELDDGEDLECDSVLEELATNPTFRQHYEDVFYNPVKHDESAVIYIKSEDGREIEKMELTELESFKKIDGRSIDSKTDNKTKNIRFTQVNFDSGTKGWRAELPNQDKDVAVKVTDTSFLNKVDKSETALVKGSLFEVELEIKTFFKVNQSPTYRYTITKVLKHRTSKDKKLL